MKRNVSICAFIFAALMICANAAHAAEVGYSGEEDRGLVLLKKGDVSVRLYTRLQLQAAMYTGEDLLITNDDPANFEGFRVRRARLGFEGNFHKHLAYDLSVNLHDGLKGSTQINDAWIGYTRWSFARLYLGVGKVPIAHADLVSSGRLGLLERPLSVRRLVPTQRIGFTIQGEVPCKKIRYNVGLYNGAEGFSFGNENPGVIIAGRVAYAPKGFLDDGDSDRKRKPFRIQFGAGVLYRTGPAVTELTALYDLALKVRGFSFSGGFLWSRIKPLEDPQGAPSVGGETYRNGYYAQFGMMLYKDILELVVRGDVYDDNQHYADSGHTIDVAGGLNLYLLGDLLKIQAIYLHRIEYDGAELNNNAVILQVQLNR